MVDFHSHILPGMDDGSASVEESLAMLETYSPRTTDICLTPHFYPSKDRPEKFFERRQRAFERLMESLPGDYCPRLHLGAEVYYFPGIQHSAQMAQFRLGGSDLILVELPASPWTGRMMDDVLALGQNTGLRPVLAHIDRYHFAEGDRAPALNRYLDGGGLVQMNAEALLSWRTRHKAVSMIRRGMVHFVGSDAHNMTTRRPNLEEMCQKLSAGRNTDVLEILEENASCYFQNGKE